jgi:tetratricopeptide (TPR) repeat protein
MLVGREQELGVLTAHYEKMLAGSGSVLFLAGEAGLGKTTLVHEWASGIGHQALGNDDYSSDVQHPAPNACFLESACSIPIGNVHVGQMEALQPWVDVMDQGVGMLPQAYGSGSAGAPKRKFDVKKFLVDTAPSWITMVPLLGPSVGAAMDILGAGYDQFYLNKRLEAEHEVQPATNQQQVFQQYSSFLSKLADALPVVVFLDDMHWADASSCNLLFYLSRQLSTRRILVIATYRLNEVLGSSGDHGHPVLTVRNEILRYGIGAELELSALSDSAVCEYLKREFPRYVSNAPFEEWLEQVSDGNPLFLTQFIQALRDDGLISDSGVPTGDYRTIPIPRSLTAVTEERIGRLDERTRQVLAYAAVEGEEFTAVTLEQLTGMRPVDLLGSLQGAFRSGVIGERGTMRWDASTSTALFGFTHSLFRRVLYNGLLQAQRDLLHRQCYTILKSAWDGGDKRDGRLSPLSPRLMIHASMCREWTVVADVGLAAAREFWATYSEEEALAMIVRVIGACERSAGGMERQRAEAILLRGSIHELHGRSERALCDYQEAEQGFRKVGDQKAGNDALNQQAVVLAHMSKYNDAITVAVCARDEAQQMGYGVGVASALSLIGGIHEYRGLFVEARHSFEASVAILRGLGMRMEEAALLNNIGTVCVSLGQYNEAIAFHLESLSIRKEMGNRAGEAISLGNVGVAYWNLGKYDKALEAQVESLRIKHAIGDLLGEGVTLNNIGSIYFARNACQEAITYFEQSLKIRRAVGDRSGEAKSLSNLGLAYCEQGAYVQAIEFHRESLAIRDEIGDRAGVAISSTQIGRVLRRQGKCADARAHVEYALAVAQDINASTHVLDAMAELGRLCAQELLDLSGPERDSMREHAARIFTETAAGYRALGRERDADLVDRDIATLVPGAS